MTKNIITLTILLFAHLSICQKVEVTESSEKLSDVTRTGLSINLKLSEKMVSKGWEKFLKEHGKIDSKKGEYLQELGDYKDLAGTPVRNLSKVFTTKNGMVTVFWAIDLGNEYISRGSNKWQIAQKLIHDFGVSMYIEDINEQVKEAEEALEDASKKQEKKIKDGENLVRKVEDNKNDKAKLEQKLKDNAQDLKDLEKAQEQNKLDQAEAQKEVDKMKKAVELTKQKIKSVE